MRASTSCLLLIVALAAAAPHVLAGTSRQLMPAQKCALPADFPRASLDLTWSPADLSAACTKGTCADCWCILAISYGYAWTPAVLKDARLKSKNPQVVLSLYREVIGDCFAKTSSRIPNYPKVYATWNKCSQWTPKGNYGWAFIDPKKNLPANCKALVQKIINKSLGIVSGGGVAGPVFPFDDYLRQTQRNIERLV